MTGRQNPIKAEADFDALGQLLRQYGMNLIDDDTFWRLMKVRGWGQDDIDRWCEKYYPKENLTDTTTITDEFLRRFGPDPHPDPDEIPTPPTFQEPVCPGDATPLIGLRIQLDRTIEVPCGSCGQTAVVIGPGTGPHAASVRCANCFRHCGWLSNPIVDFLAETIRRFGPPSDTIKIRNPEIRESELTAPRVHRGP